MNRVLSKDSIELYDNLFPKEMCATSDSEIDSESPRSIISALFALKFAHRSERITDAEKNVLKERLRNKTLICDSILFKVLSLANLFKNDSIIHTEFLIFF